MKQKDLSVFFNKEIKIESAQRDGTIEVVTGVCVVILLISTGKVSAQLLGGKIYVVNVTDSAFDGDDSFFSGHYGDGWPRMVSIV